MSELIDAAVLALALGAVSAARARGAAATISVAHRRPWLRGAASRPD